MSSTSQNMNLNISNGTIIRIILFGVFIISLIKLRNLVLVILTSIVIASFIESAVLRFKKYIKNRALLVFLIYLVCGSVLFGIFYVFIPVLVNEVSAIAGEVGKYVSGGPILDTFQGTTINDAKNVVTSISKNVSLPEIINQTKNFAAGFSGGFFSVAGSVFGGVINLVLIIIISFYLSMKEKGIENFLRIIIPKAQEDYAIDLWLRTERKIGLWMQGQMLVGLIVGILIYLGLTIMGVKYALVLALASALFELIPFGMILAFVPAVAISYVDGGFTAALMVSGLYIIVQQFEGYLIYPLVVKKIIGIPPLVVVISLIAGAQLAGFWGIILSIPVAVLLLEFLGDIEKEKILARNS